ncbi:Flavin reductase [Moritella sp. JT01]|nr:Flavin reductase [Moritella sp. JT01]
MIIIINNVMANNMNEVVIFGAASGLGLAMVNYFTSHGVSVIGVARNVEKNALSTLCDKTYQCDATDQAQVSSVVESLSKDAIVISTMGSFRADIPVDYIGHRHLIDALESAGINRFLLVTSLGCGDSWQFMSARSKAGFGSAVREKSLAESYLQTSTLDFTILRPGGLKDGDVTNAGDLSQGKEVHGMITRHEVARLAHALLLQDKSKKQVFECVDPTVVYG